MRLKEKLDAVDFAYGTWSQTGSPEVLEMLGFSRQFAFTIIDTEHGYYDLAHAENLVRAADASGISPIVRVGLNDPYLITKALDLGAQGILVPNIATAAQAHAFVAATQFSPAGKRGACPFVRAGEHLVTDWADYAHRADQDIFTMVLVEGEEGFANLEAIAQTERLDALMIGPMDLTVSLGIGGQLDHPRLKHYIADAVTICERHGVKFFLPNFFQTIATATQATRDFMALGVKYFTMGSDKLFLAAYLRQQHDALAALQTQSR